MAGLYSIRPLKISTFVHFKDLQNLPKLGFENIPSGNPVAEPSHADNAAGAHRGGHYHVHVVHLERQAVRLREVHVQAGAAGTGLRQPARARM
jgi:hypothetical protein